MKTQPLAPQPLPTITWNLILIKKLARKCALFRQITAHRAQLRLNLIQSEKLARNLRANFQNYRALYNLW